MASSNGSMDRREFLKATAAGATTLAGVLAGPVRAEQTCATAPAGAGKLIWRNKQPTMTYQRLGRTNFMCSRIVAGSAGNLRLRMQMIERGLNYFDTAWGYGDGKNERDLAAVLKRARDRVWITSKSSDIAGYRRVDAELKRLYDKAVRQQQDRKASKPDLRAAGRHAARLFSRMLDESLQRLQTEWIDCYMMHGVEIPWFFDLHEVWQAYERAHKAGKVRHFGISTHGNVKQVLQRTLEADIQGPWKIDLIMPAVSPPGYEDLREVIGKLKQRDIGIIAMKTSGQIKGPDNVATKQMLQRMDELKFNKHQRCYAYMLHAPGIDAVISAIRNQKMMEENFLVANTRLTAGQLETLRARVALETQGVCRHCNRCEAACPHGVPVAQVLRLHSYWHHYGDRQLARELYRRLERDPARLCERCGGCRSVCPAGIALDRVVAEAAATLA